MIRFSGLEYVRLSDAEAEIKKAGDEGYKLGWDAARWTLASAEAIRKDERDRIVKEVEELKTFCNPAGEWGTTMLNAFNSVLDRIRDFERPCKKDPKPIERLTTENIRMCQYCYRLVAGITHICPDMPKVPKPLEHIDFTTGWSCIEPKINALVDTVKHLEICVHNLELRAGIRS